MQCFHRQDLTANAHYIDSQGFYIKANKNYTQRMDSVATEK